jgi:hypothetical protein
MEAAALFIAILTSLIEVEGDAGKEGDGAVEQAHNGGE